MTVSEDWYEKEYGNQSIWLQARKKDVEDSTNPLTEVKTTTKDANGNETTVIKKGKFDKELATKKAYEQAVAEATNPVGMESVPSSVFDDFRNSEEYKRGTAGQNYKEMMGIDNKRIGTSYPGSATQANYNSLMQPIGTPYSGGPTQANYDSLMQPLGTSYSGSATQAEYDSLMRKKNAAREYAANLTMPRMIDGSNSLLFPQSMVATAREGTPQEIADREYAEWEAKMKGQGQVMDSQGSYQSETTDDTYFGIPGERDGPMALNTRSLGTSYPGGALQDPSIFEPLGTSYPGSPTQANYDSLMREREARAAELENMKNAQIMAQGFKSGDAQNMAQGFREADAQGMAQGFISADLEKEARAAELENMKNAQIMAYGFKAGDEERIAREAERLGTSYSKGEGFQHPGFPDSSSPIFDNTSFNALPDGKVFTGSMTDRWEADRKRGGTRGDGEGPDTSSFGRTPITEERLKILEQEKIDQEVRDSVDRDLFKKGRVGALDYQKAKVKAVQDARDKAEAYEQSVFDSVTNPSGEYTESGDEVVDKEILDEEAAKKLLDEQENADAKSEFDKWLAIVNKPGVTGEQAEASAREMIESATSKVPANKGARLKKALIIAAGSMLFGSSFTEALNAGFGVIGKQQEREDKLAATLAKENREISKALAIHRGKKAIDGTGGIEFDKKSKEVNLGSYSNRIKATKTIDDNGNVWYNLRGQLVSAQGLGALIDSGSIPGLRRETPWYNAQQKSESLNKNISGVQKLITESLNNKKDMTEEDRAFISNRLESVSQLTSGFLLLKDAGIDVENGYTLETQDIVMKAVRKMIANPSKRKGFSHYINDALIVHQMSSPPPGKGAVSERHWSYNPSYKEDPAVLNSKMKDSERTPPDDAYMRTRRGVTTFTNTNMGKDAKKYNFNSKFYYSIKKFEDWQISNGGGSNGDVDRDGTLIMNKDGTITGQAKANYIVAHEEGYTPFMWWIQQKNRSQ